MSDMDVQRAVAILNRAAENHMYDATKIPESDVDKITAAEQQVQLCEQVEQVVHGAFPGVTDERVIAQSVPHWPGVVKILAEAKVFVGLNGPPSTPRQVAVEEPTITDPPKATEQVVNVDTQDPEPLAAVKPDPPAPQGPDRSEPSKGEVWLDSQGNAWEVVSYYGGQSAEVRNVASGEPTIVPTGFLKRRELASEQKIVDMNVLPDQPVAVIQEPKAAEPSPSPQGPTDDGHQPLSSAPVEDHPPETPENSDPSAMSVTYEEDADADENVGLKEHHEYLSIQPSPTGVSIRQGPQAVDLVSHKDDRSSAMLKEQDKYDIVVERVQDRYQIPGMPEPTELENPSAIKAEDFSNVDDAMARFLHGHYNALTAYAKYRHDVEDAISRECDLVRTYHMRRAMAQARREIGKDATVTEVKIIAETDPLVAEWSAYAREHAEEARAIKTFHDIYAQHVVVLSRDWSMREAQVR